MKRGRTRKFKNINKSNKQTLKNALLVIIKQI